MVHRVKVGEAPGGASTAVSARLAALGYMAVVAVVTWPVPIRLGQLMLGAEYSDLYAGAWGFWWMARSLALHQSPFHCDLLCFPFGGDLLVADPLNAVLSVPLQWALPLPVAYNLVIMAHLWLAGFSTYCLLRYLRVPAPAAWCGGLVYGFNPYVLGYVCNGVSQEVAVGWLSLFALRFLMVLRRPTRGNIAIAGIVLALGMASSPYHAACLVLMIPVLAFPSLRRPRLRLRCLRPIVLVSVVGVMLFSVVLMGQLRVLQSPQTLEVRGGLSLRMTLESQDGSDLLRWVWMGKKAWGQPRYVHLPYVGLFCLCLALLGAVRLRRSPSLLAWGGLFLASWLLSCGFFLQVADRMVLVGGRPVPLPFLFLVRWMPGFAWLQFPHRLAPPALLAASVLASRGVEGMAGFLPARLRTCMAHVTAGVLLLDFLLLSPLPFPLLTTSTRVPVFYQQVGQDPTAFGVVDLPTDSVRGLHVAKRYLFQQTVHGKGIPYGIDATLSNPLSGAFDRIRSLRELVMLVRSPGASQRRVHGAEVVRQLREQGFRFVVLHTEHLDETALAELRWLLDPVTPSPRADGDLLIYSLEERP